MNNHTNNNSIFKVPKLKSKDFLEHISTNSSEYKSEILPNIVSNFKNPSLSQKKMNITSVWLINNSFAEDRYIRRRQMMRKEMPKLSYSVGFMFINDFQKLTDIARSGKIEVGNVKNSHLAKSSMGVSLCLYADIYHPGYKIVGVPDKGYLLLVKYLKGKINYVPCDDSPMDPQPQYDCHVVKNPLIGYNTSTSKAYHQTQIFIYDYTDDGEIVKYPSKILPFAAVQFNWVGSPLFKLYESHIQKPTEIKDDRIQELKVTYLKTIQNERHVAAFNIHKKNSTSTIDFNLTIRDLPDTEMKSNVYLYFTNPIISLLRSDNNWEISGVIETFEFEKDFKRLQVMWNNNACHIAPKCLIDPLSQDIIISLNRPNLLSSIDIDNEAQSFNEFSDVAQFVTYTRVTIESYQYSKQLIELFNLTKTMGFINRPHEPDISILLFPDGSLSKKLGIPSVSDLCYFHGLVFHSQHPQFIIRNNTQEKKKEKEIYFSCLSSFKKQSIQSKFKTSQSLIDLNIFKQTIKLQAEVQKSYLFKLLKPQSSSVTIIYKPICFVSNCEDFECLYHKPIKKVKLNETTNKENIGESNEIISPPVEIIKVKERSCLSEKLFDYFKSNSDDKDCVGDYEIVQCVNNEVSQQNLNSQTSFGDLDGDQSHNKAKFSINFNAKTHQSLQQSSNREDRGIFFSLEFLNYNSARYYDSSCFHSIDFSGRISKKHTEKSDALSDSIWSLDKDLFRKSESLQGISTYE